jgi:hypothetical protein
MDPAQSARLSAPRWASTPAYRWARSTGWGEYSFQSVTPRKPNSSDPQRHRRGSSGAHGTMARLRPVETATRIDVETALRASGRTDADRRNEQLARHRELAAVINQGCLSSSTALNGLDVADTARRHALKFGSGNGGGPGGARQASWRLAISQPALGLRLALRVRQIESPLRVLRPLSTVATAAPPWRVRRPSTARWRKTHRSGS